MAPATAEEVQSGLSADELCDHLRAATERVRDLMELADAQSLVLGLLLLKRVSDRFEEEARLQVAAGEEPEVAWKDPDSHRYFVPEAARWQRLQERSSNIGEAINVSCAALEAQNSSMTQVLTSFDYNDPATFGDTKSRDAVLAQIIQDLSLFSLSDGDLADPAVPARAFRTLIDEFRQRAGKKGKDAYTPPGVTKLVALLAEPEAGMRVCDPACGSGGLLVSCLEQVVSAGGDPRNLSLHGQEKHLGRWALGKINLLLNDRPDARLKKGDTISAPGLVEGGALMPYDRVVMNPPFGTEEWGAAAAEADGFRRFTYGIPPKTKGALAFVQHAIAALSDKGKAVIVMSHGVLFASAGEGRIRRGMLEDDLFEGVIGLPPELFYPGGGPVALLVLNRNKQNTRKGKVLFIDASREFKEGSNQNYLREQEVQKIANAFHAYKDVDKYARVVDLDEIEKNDFNLNISRYVDTLEAEQKIDVASAVAKLRELETARAEAEAKMNGFLEELGYGRA